MSSRILLLALLLMPLQATAQIYEIRDENGRVVGFSDTPPGDGSEARQIEVAEPNRAAPVQPTARPEPEPVEEESIPDYKVAISSPANETGIPMGPGNFNVQATVNPGLRPGDNLQLFLDGEPWGEPQPGGSWALTNVFRGAHDLTVQVLDAGGENLAISAPTRVYVQRPSVNFRARRAAN